MAPYSAISGWMNLGMIQIAYPTSKVITHFCRSTGEFPSMTLEEREQVAEVARSTWPGRQIVNISTCNIPNSLRLLKHAQQGRGSPKVQSPPLPSNTKYHHTLTQAGRARYQLDLTKSGALLWVLQEIHVSPCLHADTIEMGRLRVEWVSHEIAWPTQQIR